MPTDERPWFVYLIECRNGSIYTGIAIDVAARYAAHAAGKGARYTRAHPPHKLLAAIAYPDRASALKEEYRIKRLTPENKRKLAEEAANPEAVSRTAPAATAPDSRA